jgi:hypothetical protein
VDNKELRRIVQPSHRATSNRKDSVGGVGWEFVHVVIDNHSRVSYVEMYASARQEAVVKFLMATVAHYKALGVTIKRILTDNDSAYRFRLFDKACQAVGHQTHLHQTVQAANQRQGLAVSADLLA